MNKKAVLEKIEPEIGSSIFFRHFDEGSKVDEPFWHFHPEIELVYVNGGSGKQHIGRHFSCFRNGTLLMIGSNLPHNGFTNRLTKNRAETILQLKPDFLGSELLNSPEFKEVNELFERSKVGISFKGETKRKVGKKMEKLAKHDPFTRFIKVIEILKQLADSQDYELLNSEVVALETQQQDNDRINTIYSFVKTHFQRPISLEEIASEVNMTVPSFCRYFKKIAGKTFTRFVNEVRIVHATKLLAEQQSSITEICYECGFNNFSHFNKIFKSFVGKNPSEYRNSIKVILK